MKMLTFDYKGQSCRYHFVASVDDNKVKYQAMSRNIGEPKSGELDENESANFIRLLLDAHIENWNSEYVSEEVMINDAGKIDISYDDDDFNTYDISGEDLCMPEEFDYLIEAIGICDVDAARYFDDSACLGEDDSACLGED